MLRKIFEFFKLMGFNPKTTLNTIKSLGWYFSDYKKLKKQLGNKTKFPINRLRPILYDKYESSGILSGHYFHQDLLIAQKIFNAQPLKHVDIGSRTDGFVAHVATFMLIEVFDIRPLASNVKNIQFVQADFTKPNPNLKDYTDSISCLHAIEHFGLGRYHDTIDADGHLKGLENIYNILKPGGVFYFSTPIGPQRIEFNAHRVFSVQYLIEMFKNKFEIEDFSYVNDEGNLFNNVALTEPDVSANYGCTYGCGIFQLKKL